MPDYAVQKLPVSDRLAAETLWFTTAVLMGARRDCEDVVTAVAKVQANAAELAGV